MKDFEFKIQHQGAIKMANNIAYMVKGGPEAVCFYIDPDGRSDVVASTNDSDSGCPVVFLSGANEG